MNYIRRIRLPHLYNLRDLGGYEKKDGDSTKWHRLYRSDCPDMLEDEEWQRLRELDIRTLIDLRSSFEIAVRPVKPPSDFTYLHMPFIYEKAEDLSSTHMAARKFMESVSNTYPVMFENSLENVKEIISAIYEKQKDGAVMFFCTAGKDRTGIIAAVYLLSEGVCNEDIIADYSVTELYNIDEVRRRIEAMPKAYLDRLSDEQIGALCKSNPEKMHEFLDFIQTKKVI